MDSDDGAITESLKDEYLNCGYDGCHEIKEKAVILNCVGRGLKLPPLSKIRFPSFLLKGSREQTELVRPSHHILELLSPTEEASEKPGPEEQPLLNERPSNQKGLPEPNGDGHSEVSDVEVYLSDDDDNAIDECDSRPAAENVQDQNSSEKSEKNVFLPMNLVCEVECSPAGNKIVVNETGHAKNDLNENDDSVTSDSEVFSNPSCPEDSGSDNEEVSAPSNNLNMAASCSKINRSDSTKNVNSHVDAGAPNILVDKDTSTASSALPKAGDVFQKDEHLGGYSNMAENHCLEENAVSEDDGRWECPSNIYQDPVAELFSSDESLEDPLVYHFRTFNPEVNLAVNCNREFPSLPGKDTETSQKKKCQLESVPGSQLRIKNIAKLLLSGSADAAASGEDDDFKVKLKPPNPELVVIENLPPYVNKEYLENFLQQFATIKNITLIPHPDKMTAKIQYAETNDLDWIVQCLDGNRIFGVESPIVRCYRQ